MKKLSMIMLRVIYGIYNTFAILTVIALFVSQKGWTVIGNKREYRKI